MKSRIPDTFIQLLLQRVDIVDVIRGRVEIKKAGREYRGRSPFTNEKTPSFYVSPQKQMFFDFSSGKNGTAINFLMEFERLSFIEAIESLAESVGMEVPREGGGERLVLDGPIDALAAASRFYQQQLRGSDEAIAYLKKRGVTGETAKRFQLGMAPEGWDALTKQFQNNTLQHAIDAGLLIAKDGGGAYDRFRHRVMFPIRDTRGRTIGFGGRTLGNDPAKYLNSPETVLFHKGSQLFGLFEAKQASKSALPFLLVVEGYMDVVMLSQYGITEAVATLGTATTPEHVQLLFKHTAKVVFCFDGDRAGRAAAWRALENTLPALGEGREAAFMFLPDGQDPDSWVQAIGAEAFKEKIQSAQSLVQFFTQNLAQQVNLSSPDGRAQLVALVRPYLKNIDNEPLRAALVQELKQITRLPQADLQRLLRGDSSQAQHTPQRETLQSTGLKPEVRRLFQYVLELPHLAQRVSNLQQLHDCEVVGVPLLARVIEFFQTEAEARAAELLAAWPVEAERALLLALSQAPLPAFEDRCLEAEFVQHIQGLQQRSLRQRALALIGRQGQLSEAEQQELLVLKASLR